MLPAAQLSYSENSSLYFPNARGAISLRSPQPSGCMTENIFSRLGTFLLIEVSKPLAWFYAICLLVCSLAAPFLAWNTQEK